MKINRDELKKLAEKSDSDLWREIQRIAKSHGYSIPEATPKPEELEKIRRALLGTEKINLTDAAKIISNYKKNNR